MRAEKGKKYAFADFELDVQKRQLTACGESVGLNARAFDLLVYLVVNAGRLVSKEEVLEAVWKDQFVEESNLTVQISYVRKALGDNTTAPRFLATIPGKGYQFVADVVDITDPGSMQAPLDHTEAGDVPDIVISRRGVWPYVVAAAVVVGIAGVFISWTVWPSEPTVRSLAVLPFVSDTRDETADILADGLAESVIFSLSRVSGLKVLSRDSSFRYRDAASDARSIGRDLRVGGVLSGRITIRDNTLIVRTELVSTEDNSVLWGEQFSRRMEDIELLQIDIARAIADRLQITLSGGSQTRLARVQTDDHEAFQYYLAGRYHLSRATDDGFHKARENFQVAISKDPRYALAYSGLAEAYNLLSGWGAIAPNDGFPLAKAAALKALEIDPELAEAHTQLAIVQVFYDHSWSAAEAELAKAVALNPSHPGSHFMLSMLLLLKQRFEEARMSAGRAIELDPLSIHLAVAFGNIYIYERRFDDAQEKLRRVVEMDPNSGLAHWSLGNAYLHGRKFAEAITEFETARQLSGTSSDEPASLAIAHAKMGRKDEAIKILEELLDRKDGAFVSHAVLATIYTALDDKDRAFENLEKSVRERDALLPFLKIDPYFDPLRDDPRFDELVRRLGLP